MTTAAWPTRRSVGSLRGWVPIVAAVGVLGVVMWRLGDGPFVAGLRAIDATTLAAAFVIGLVTTLCCAWRWTIVARGLGVELTLPAAVAAYYRSLFLNVTLPGGVVGDLHRGVSHGRDAHSVPRGLRAVGWERTGGQAVQMVLTVAVLLVLPSPVRGYMPWALAVFVAVVVCVLAAGARWRRARHTIGADLRGIARVRLALPVIVLTSAVVVAGHAVTFLLAAHAAGSQASVSRMVPLALLAMLAMALPSVAGWGPREGAAGWAFAAAGLGAGLGVTTAVVYGVMALVACLPGAVVLLWSARPQGGEASNA